MRSKWRMSTQPSRPHSAYGQTEILRACLATVRFKSCFSEDEPDEVSPRFLEARKSLLVAILTKSFLCSAAISCSRAGNHLSAPTWTAKVNNSHFSLISFNSANSVQLRERRSRSEGADSNNRRSDYKIRIRRIRSRKMSSHQSGSGECATI